MCKTLTPKDQKQKTYYTHASVSRSLLSACRLVIDLNGKFFGHVNITIQ